MTRSFLLLLLTAHCLRPTAFCLLPTAYCLLPTAFCPPPTVHCYCFCLLPSAHRLLFPLKLLLYKVFVFQHAVEFFGAFGASLRELGMEVFLLIFQLMKSVGNM